MISIDDGFAQSPRRGYDPASTSTAAQNLATAMRRNAKLRLVVGSGYYDLMTTVGNADYQFTHMALPAASVTLKNYPAGHMPYLGDDSAAKLADDLRAFIAGAS